jgi:4-diphosphocytidyl-2-C-methyl-D-erythritol kinase
MAADRTLRLRAFAKINLSLQVVGVRPDGYHQLRTLFQSLALHDTLTLTRTRGPFVLMCDDARCPVDGRNLVWRAAEAVWRAAGRRGAPEGVRARLQKRIPIEAGLGGGSSDAAAALRGYGRLWRVSERALRAIGAELGADVPFFFQGGTCLGLERGDRLEPQADVPAAWVVLAIPPFGVSTKEAFGWYDAMPAPKHSRAGRASANDLEAPVAARHPVIGELVDALESLGARQAAMTGSGSTVFGLFDRRPAAEKAAARLGRGAIRTLITRTLPAARYGERARPELQGTA